MAIGEYGWRYVVMRRVTAQDPKSGQKRASWPDGVEAWGKFPDESSADKRHTAQQVESRAETIIALRGWVDVSAHDRIRLKSTGDVYRIDGVRRGPVETIIEAHRRTEGEQGDG